MDSFVKHSGLVAPLDRVDIDTDQIIPKQFLKRIERTGYGQFLFFDWRLLTDGSLNSDFILNYARYQGATVLVTGRNFGCGSSREHAPWALQDYGFKAIIAPSFADIFHNNCFQNGILPVVLKEDEVSQIMDRAKTNIGYEITVDLGKCSVVDALGFSATFHVDEFRRDCLMNGLDDIGLTLLEESRITEFEERVGLV